MKPVMLLVAGILLFLGTGLVSAGPAPDLSGTWIEEMVDGYMHSGERFNTTSAGDYWIITQQDGLITGTNFFTTPGGEVVEEPVAGVVSPEGTVLSLVDSSGGTYTATLTGDDTLLVQYLNTGDRMTDIADMALSEIDSFTIDGDQTLDHQWIETTLDEVLTQICNRFGYYYRFTVDGKFSARKITNAGAINHTYTDNVTIIEYSPDDTYSDFTNRVTVTGQERDFTTVIYPEEQVAVLNGTIGWWGCKKEHVVWFSIDRSRRCVNPRLVIIETASSIPLQLAGDISERLEQCTDADDNKFCTVIVEAPNLTANLIASIAGYLAATQIPEPVEEGTMTIPIGRIAEGVSMMTITAILGSVANYQYEIWAQPLGSIRRSVQATADDTTHQEEIACVVENKFEDPLCYSAADCAAVAAFELMVAQMQRKRVTIQKVAHLQDEDGDTLRFVHPYSGENIDLYVTNIRRKFKKGPDGYFIDEIDGWVVNQ